MSVMCRTARGLVVGAALAAPAWAFAQEKAGLDTTPASSWSFRLAADGSWYENAYFVGAAETEWSTSGQATLSHARRFRTGTFSLSGFGGAIYYPEVDDFNQPTYGGSLGLDWAPSRRTRLNLGQTYQRSSTRYVGAFAPGGVPLPTAALDNATSSVGLEHQLSQSWQLGLDGSFVYYDYDDERLLDGKELTAVARLGHRVGRHGSLYLGYGYSAGFVGSDTLRSHQALVGGRRRKERGASFELAGGVGYVESTESFYPAGRAGLSVAGRRATLALSYSRDFGQAFGYGRQMIGDIASAALVWTPGRRLSFNAGYNFGYRRDPADESYTITSSVASAGFDWKVGGGVNLGARYGWERNETEGLPVVEGSRATAALSWGVDWK